MTEQNQESTSAETPLADLAARVQALGDKTPLTINESAQILRCSRQTIYRMHWAGRLPLRKNGASAIVMLGDLNKAIADLPRVDRASPDKAA